MTVLSFPSSARDDAPDHEYTAAMMALRGWFFTGMANGYLQIGAIARGHDAEDYSGALRDYRREAVAGSTFDAWTRATAGSRNNLRTKDAAFASGFMAAWADHPQAEQCVNCDLPFVPGIEDGWQRCVDHGMTCSPACTSEICRVPSCREDD